MDPTNIVKDTGRKPVYLPYNFVEARGIINNEQSSEASLIDLGDYEWN